MLKQAFILIVSLLMWPGIGASQPSIPNGNQFQVNQYTTSWQHTPHVTSLASSRFVVVWESFESGYTDTDSSSIQAQLFTEDGTKIGSQFQVNTYTTEFQQWPDVSEDGSGGFVVVWQSYGSSGSDHDHLSVQGRQFDLNGTPMGPEFQVNTYTTSFQNRTRVSLDSSGGFVVVWSSYGSNGADTRATSIQGQRFTSSGLPIGTEFEVNTYTTSGQGFASVSPMGTEGFIVTWESGESAGSDSNQRSIQGQRFESDGSAAGAQFQVNNYTYGPQRLPSSCAVGLDRFVVVWYIHDMYDSEVRGRIFTSEGIPVDTEFSINTYLTSNQVGAAVSPTDSGGFIVVWGSDGSSGTDHSSFSIQGQRYSSLGSRSGSAFQVNSYTTDSQARPDIVMVDSERHLVTWQSIGSSGSDSDFLSIQAQALDTEYIFRDGFESGDFSEWTTSSP